MKIPPPRDATIAYWLTWWLAWFLHLFIVRVTREGAEHVPDGGAVLACNHTPGHDYVSLGFAAPRQVWYMVKAEAFRYFPPLSAWLRSIGCFPVHRGMGDDAAFRTALQVVEAGHLLGMFPEGHRSPTSQLQAGKTGAVRIALAAGVPIVPAVVIGQSAVMPVIWRPWLRPPVTVRFGTPFRLEGDPDNRADLERGTAELMTVIATMLPAEMRGEWAEEAAARERAALYALGDVFDVAA